ncbi:MAG: ChbG/HpnK family deacetylase [Bombilactobacillus sp.]
MNQLLIRADDLGYSKGINYGIYESVKNGIINNVGVMINMPATKHGLDLLQGMDIDLGLHTNICAGKPLSDPREIRSITDENGFFKASKVYRNAKADFVDLNEAIKEIEAQYQRFLKVVGRKPDYFEAHAIYSANFLKALEIVAAKYDAALLPFNFDLDPVTFKSKTTIVTFMDSMKPNYDPLQTFKRALDYSKNCPENTVPMMICHPGYLDQDIMIHSSLTIPRTQEVAFVCDPQTKALVAQEKVKLVRYHELS